MIASLLPAAGPHASTTYADWADLHDPAAAPRAHELIDAMRTELARTWDKPGRFVDAMAVKARTLPPAHLPWFWDTVGHRLLGCGTRAGGRAYAAARVAETEHGLAADPAYRRANALLFAARGAMPVKEFGAHRSFLADTLDPVAAHTAFEEFLIAWAGSPADLPADLVRRVRASAKEAGRGPEEVARVVGAVLSATRKKAVPNALLDAARPVLAACPPGDAVAAGLLEVFPDGAVDGGAWLRLLIDCGAAGAMESGRIVPEDGLSGWIGRFVHTYQYAAQSGGGVARQPLPAELLDLIGRLGPALRAAGTPVALHTTRFRYQGLDADVLDACLAAGAEVVDPGAEVAMRFWGEKSRRDLAALAAHPVFGPRLEGTVHEDLLPSWSTARRRRAGTAVTLLPGNPGIAQAVAERVGKLVGTVGGGGMAGAEEAVAELATLLDRPTVRALDGIAEALDEASAAGALRRSLAAGLPEELAWPALEAVYEEFAATARSTPPAPGAPRAPDGPVPGVAGVTATWPVLTVFGTDRAVAVAPDGVRASCRFTVPDGATLYAVHYVGGSFLVSWTHTPNPYHCDTAVWADRPDDPFTPEETGGLVPFDGSLDGAYGFQFETVDGGGRHGGNRVLRPGGREGIDRDELQLRDTTRTWTNAVFGRRPWNRVDPVTGRPQDPEPLPDFPGRAPRTAPGTETDESDLSLAREALQLAPLPPGTDTSPLGSRDGLTGTRVLFRTRHRAHAPDHYLVESADGRTARFDIDRPGQEPWGLWAPPEGAVEDVVLADAETRTGVRAYAADGSLLWELDGHTTPRHRPGRPARRVTVSGGVAPPPAFWYLLRTRDAAGSRALRTADRETAEALLAAALTGGEETLDAAVARHLPQVTDPVLARAVASVAARAARVEQRRTALHRRVTVLAQAAPAAPRRTVPDTDLLPALFGLTADEERVPGSRPAPPSPQPATLSALAADGACLAGTIDEEVRRLSPPAPPHDWSVLLGTVDAAAWRAAVAPTPDGERAALLALLDTWADQPVARPGLSWWTGRAPAEALDRLRGHGAPVASGAVRPGSGTHWFVTPAHDAEDAPAPADVPDARRVRTDRDDAARLRTLLTALEEHGPLPVPEAAAERFAERTGVRRALARLVVAGLIGRPDPKEHRALVGKAPYRATPMTADSYDRLRTRLGAAGRRAVLAAAVPDDPAGLWRPGGVEAAVDRMAEAWCARLGTLPRVDDAAADALEAGLGLSEVWARRLAGGYEAASDAALPAAGWELAARRHGRGTDVRAVPPAGPRPPYGTPVGLDLRQTASALVWACTDRPVGDPATAGAHDLHRRLRAELARPELLLDLHLARVRDTPERIAERFGPRLFPVSTDGLKPDSEAPETAYDSGALIVCAPGGTPFLRPTAITDAETWRRLRDLTDLTDELDRLEPLLEGGGLDRMMRRARSGAVPDGAYEADPRHSCPDLVARVAKELGTGPDAAALYLQLAALAAPTDRDVRRWTGWSAGRHAEVRAELLATGAVVEAKRARAGRTLFVPGAWTELKSPHPPLETAKLATHLVRPLWRDQIRSPFGRVLPTAPLHEMFEAAWENRENG